MTQPKEPCKNHPRRRSRSHCVRCAAPLCKTCRSVRAGEHWCWDCVEREFPAPALPLPPPPAVPEVIEAPPDAAVVAALHADPMPVPRLLGPAPPAAAAAQPPSPSSRTVYWLLALQSLATLAAIAIAWQAYRVAGDVAARAARPQPIPTPISGTPVRAPSLDLRPGTTLRGAPVELHGEAAFGDFVALLCDGKPAGVALVREGRFLFTEVELKPGEHQLSVLAYRPGETPVESPRVFARYELPPAPLTPTPAASPVPQASPAASASPRPRARNILRGPLEPAIALTFDGGSEADQATAILDALADKGVRSTVFLTGDFIQLHPEVARRVVRDGHEIGNHTLHHPHLADWVAGKGHVTRQEMTRDVLLGELKATEELFERTTGRKMSRYWRAPFGEINNQLLGWAEEGGYLHVGWTEGLDTLDWVGSRSDRRYRSAAEIRDRILGAAKGGDGARGGIVLMHLGSERVADQPARELPTIIDGLRAEGYRIVTVSALLGG